MRILHLDISINYQENNKKQVKNDLLNDERRRRDSNSRAGFPTYTLSRGASSTYLSTSPFLEERGGFEPPDGVNRHRFSRPAL